MEIVFPLEFVVQGVPISSQASAVSRERWKGSVRLAASRSLLDGHFAAEGDIGVAIIYFSEGPSALDTDNIIKPILDALNEFVWIDDRQVLQVLCRKTDRTALEAFRNPTHILDGSLASEGPFVYVRLDGTVRHEELP